MKPCHTKENILQEKKILIKLVGQKLTSLNNARGVFIWIGNLQ